MTLIERFAAQCPRKTKWTIWVYDTPKGLRYEAQQGDQPAMMFAEPMNEPPTQWRIIPINRIVTRTKKSN